MRRRGGEEEQATDIKSNNPHLAGGEKSLFGSGKTCVAFVCFHSSSTLDTLYILSFSSPHCLGSLSGVIVILHHFFS